MKKAIYWFTTDLRLHDNSLLVKAIEESNMLFCVYCFNPKHFVITNFGYKKTGSFRAKFLLESLADLDQSLRKIGSGLIILKGNPADELAKFAQENKIEKIYAKEEVAYEEILTQQKVKKAINSLNCELETANNSTLYQAEDLPFSVDKISDNFTNFRHKVEKSSFIRNLVKIPTKINSPLIPAINLPTLEDFGLQEPTIDPRTAFNFVGGQTEALKRLNYYLFETKSITTYKKTRNGLIGESFSSKFSAWLSLGCLSPVTIYQEIKKFELEYTANESTYWLIFELIWRDFYRFMFKKHKQLYFGLNGINNKPNQLTINNNFKLVEMWMNGKTKDKFIDANMTELNQTGFMSNRGRQNVASYFCHNLKLDWRIGAAYFEQQLLDYDVCNNWGNWAYIAGVGNDPRESRVFNTIKQANDYDANQEYRKLWLNQQ